MALLADKNRELKQLRKMLRRREDQLKRSERENRKLRQKLGLPDPDDDPDPELTKAARPASPPSDTAPAGPGSVFSPPAMKKRPRSRGGRRPPPAHLPE